MTSEKCNSNTVKQFRNSGGTSIQPVQPVLEHRQRRGRRNIAWQAVPHLYSSNRKGTTSDSWPTTGRNVKLFSGGGPEPASVRHVGDTCRHTSWSVCASVSVVHVCDPHINGLVDSDADYRPWTRIGNKSVSKIVINYIKKLFFLKLQSVISNRNSFRVLPYILLKIY